MRRRKRAMVERIRKIARTFLGSSLRVSEGKWLRRESLSFPFRKRGGTSPRRARKKGRSPQRAFIFQEARPAFPWDRR